MYKKIHIHFIGIGGIGMSGIAKILKFQKYHISGCDSDLDQESIKELTSLGCEIYSPNNTEKCNSSSIDILVYSSAIKSNNAEVVNAQKRGIPTISRALMLAELMRTKYSIAISGSHGKTTTTSLISHILIESKQDPTVIIGGKVENLSTNAHYGKGNFLVAEADESDKSLLKLFPSLAVVTNIDLEHLDTYTDIEDIKQTFKEFLGNLPFYGKAIVCIDDPYIQSILPINNIKTIKYGIAEEKADIVAKNIQLNADHSEFELYRNQKYLGNIILSMPGKHNILNSLAAISIALELDINFNDINKALSSFKGIDRRFSFKGIYKNTEIFDDYGHHPTEIANTLIVARKRAKNKLNVIFQPHRYSRTKHLWQDFINVFSYGPIDNLIITDIYAASEDPIDSISSKHLVEELNRKQTTCKVHYIPIDPNFDQIKEKLDSILQPNDLTLLLGAGKVNKLAKILI